MGTWRSNKEMEKLHKQFVDGCLRQPGMTDEIAEELYRQVEYGPTTAYGSVAPATPGTLTAVGMLLL